MKKILIVIATLLPLMSCTAAGPASSGNAAPASATASASNMLAQLPAFLSKLDSARGTALSLSEKVVVTGVVTQGDNAVNGIQSQFLGTVSKYTGLDSMTLAALFPSATQPVSDSDLNNKLEGKLGSKLSSVQKAGLKTANTLRNNSLDNLKTSMSDGVAKKLGMDPVLVSSLMPLLGL